MSSFGLHAGKKTRTPSIAPNVKQFLNFVNSWLVHVLLDNAVNK